MNVSPKTRLALLIFGFVGITLLCVL